LVAAAGAYALALLLAKWRPSLAAFRFAAPLGALSFGLYAFARPIEFLVFAHPAIPRGVTGFIAAALLTILLGFGLAWLFESRIQPALNRKLAPRQTAITGDARELKLAAERA
jgi:peptidoglycan/LPS O-acetylase OafA/YrhL